MASFSQLLVSYLTGGSGYWKLNEPGGTIAADSYGSKLGTYVNTPTFGTLGPITGEPVNTGITLTAASSQYVNVASFNTATAPWTLGAWMKSTDVSAGVSLLGDFRDATGGVLLYAGGAAGAAAISLYVNAGHLDYAGGVGIIDGAWHFVVGTYDGTNAQIFWDGALVAGPTAKTGPLAASAVTMQLGAYDTSHFLGGSLASLFATPQILTAAQVAALYAARAAEREVLTNRRRRLR